MDTARERELIAQHKALKTERERANFETQVVLELRRTAPELVAMYRGSRDLIAAFFGVSIQIAECRLRMVQVGDLAEPLWPLVDDDLPLRTAVDLIRKAKTLRVAPESTMTALKRTIAEYYARPFVRRMPNGKVSRHRSVKELDNAPPAATVPAPPPPPPSEPPPPTPRLDSSRPREDLSTSKGLYKEVRELMLTYVHSQLPDHAPEDYAELLSRFETDVKVAFDSFVYRIGSMRRDETPLRAVITRRQLVDACRELQLDPPRTGTKVLKTFYDQAKRRYRDLARQYHPDRHGGSEATRGRFESVTEAWRILQNVYETQNERIS